MFTSPKDLASLEMTCNWMRSSRVMSRVVKRKLDGHLSECGFEDPNTNARKTKEQVMKQLIPRENETDTMILEFLKRSSRARSLACKIGLGSYHSAFLLRTPKCGNSGEEHSCADKSVESRALLHTCGRGFHGQLGHGDFDRVGDPTVVRAAVSIDEPGSSSATTNLEIMKSLVAVACGGNHTCALTKDGKLLTWGLASSGELGHGGWTPIEMARPRLVSSLSNLRVTSIAAGANHTIAITSCCGVWTCGRGRHGQLGHGHFNDAGPLQRVNALSDRKIVGGAAGATHSVVYSADGAIYSWGANESGQLGHGAEVAAGEHGLWWPRRINALRHEFVSSVAAGAHHTLVITKTGTLYAFGRNRHGALGLGDTSNSFLPERVDVHPDWMRPPNCPQPRIAAAAAGAYHSIVLCGLGRVYTCGTCNFGQLGQGDMTPTTMFSEVKYFNRSRHMYRVDAIAAGDNHCVAVDSNGDIHVWGRGDWGQLGLNSNRSYWEPERFLKGRLPED